MIRVWGRLSSFNVQKVMWLIGELDIVYQHIPAGGQFGVIDTPDFLTMNPHGRVPVIQDSDGTVVWESHSILRYLAAQYGSPHFWSDDIGQRSEIDSWMDWCQTSLQPAFLTGVFWGYYRTPEAQRDLHAIAKNVTLCAEFFQRVDQLLSRQPFIGGQSLSLADIPLGTHLYRYFSLDIPRPSLPNVLAWYERLQQRPAFRKHVMVPFKELFGRLDY
ncbi:MULTISPECIES: glutathione S-transferase family protein [Pseudomonas fluorescens group]|uniref:GstB_1 protein n=1 Tax=Pseudomonas fluorescens TaxID=294 RepID=A0A0D0TS66_PSEFL|nr:MULTISPECIES: glutathione S-transferase family protein [Pseudomonas fluorescens group]AZE62722.1 putative glutathione S-transferase-like protein [Pseudomonas synxantha]KIR23645.1 Glutathione S-transferase GstB [Pseudomonas fluorescens]